MWLWRVVLAVRCTTFALPWLAHLFVADICLSALLPVSAVVPDLAYNASSAIAASVWHGIQIVFTRINRAKIVVSGVEKLPIGESAIVVANHVEWADFYMIQELAIKCGMLSRCRWFAKQQLRWVPFLGWGLWAMGFPLVSRRWTEDQREMDRVFHGVLKRKWPTCKFERPTRTMMLSGPFRLALNSIFQGSFHTAKALDTLPLNDQKLRHGVKQIRKLWPTICCSRATKVSWHRCRSYDKHLT